MTLVASAEAKDIWEWMDKHPRNAYPTAVEFWPQTETFLRASWITVEPGSASEGAHVKASIDPGSNTITIDAEGVPTATLYLSDALVDLDRPLRIVANGASREVGVVRSRATFLEMLRTARMDPGQVYVATERVDLPVVAKSESGEGAEEASGTE